VRRKDLEGGGRVHFKVTIIPAFPWRDWRRTRRTPVGMSINSDEIRSRYLPNTISEQGSCTILLIVGFEPCEPDELPLS